MSFGLFLASFSLIEFCSLSFSAIKRVNQICTWIFTLAGIKIFSFATKLTSFFASNGRVYGYSICKTSNTFHIFARKEKELEIEWTFLSPSSIFSLSGLSDSSRATPISVRNAWYEDNGLLSRPYLTILFRFLLITPQTSKRPQFIKSTERDLSFLEKKWRLCSIRYICGIKYRGSFK